MLAQRRDDSGDGRGDRQETEPNGATLMLHESRIADPASAVALMRNVIDALRIDLSGLTVLIEAACGEYVCTPVIAALPGAKRVLALTRDAKYGTVSELTRLARAFERICVT